VAPKDPDLIMTSRLKLGFLGGASAIGASCTLIEAGDAALLVDCGVRFRTGDALPDLDELSGRRLDAVVLTHAHSDHSGALPLLHAAFPDTPVYLTPPTADLIGILQRDALRIMESAEREDELPLYSERQVEALLGALRPVHHGQSFAVRDLELTLLPASHILGASMLHVATSAGSVLLTGDYSVSAQRTVPALPRPDLHVDLLVTESTYGNRLHADRKSAERRLIARVLQTLEAGGRVLVPAFAIGRAQEVLLLLRHAIRNGRLPRVPVFADGMVRAVCNVYAAHERYVSEPLAREIRAAGHPFFADPVRPIRRPEERKEALDAGPCVIVASSGMLAGGPSAYYAAELAPHEQDAILITGYQDEESPGRALLKLAEQSGPRELRLGDRIVEVRCAFETYSLSAHADRLQMTALADALRPRTVVLVHGDEEAKRGLHESLGRSVHDIESGEDGGQLARAYPARGRSRPRPQQQAPQPLEPEAAEDEATEEPEGLAAARRRELERQAAAKLEEQALAERLKAENPKGRLLELCMRRRLEAPRKLETRQDGLYVAEWQVEAGGRRVSGGIHRASSAKLAEQLAARALLEELEREAGAEGAEPVPEARLDALRRDNPKGRLIELCMQRRLGAPEIRAEAVPGGFHARAAFGGHKSRLWRAARQKDAEQAAAAELLEMLARQPDGAAQPADAGPDARMQLNELRQRGFIEDFGYELLEQSGASHQPRFRMRAWAQAPGGAREAGPEAEAPSKKEAQLQAATQLLDLLHELHWC
jgi:Cft2 family RNA processing exonuclease/dsRNA-specific ribonuclease